MTCSIENCNKPISCRDWCAAHYTKWQRHGDPLYKKPLKTFEKCIVEGCERKQVSKTYCSKHYIKLKRTGTLETINFTEVWKKKNSEARLTPLSRLDSTRDPKNRGYLAVNVINDLKSKARKRGLAWNLDPVIAYKLITSECTYCPFIPNWPNKRVGIDRVDNHLGYTEDNCVPCCFTCNSAKGDKTIEEFISWVKAVNKKLSTA